MHLERLSVAYDLPKSVLLDASNDGKLSEYIAGVLCLQLNAYLWAAEGPQEKPVETLDRRKYSSVGKTVVTKRELYPASIWEMVKKQVWTGVFRWYSWWWERSNGREEEREMMEIVSGRLKQIRYRSVDTETVVYNGKIENYITEVHHHHIHVCPHIEMTEKERGESRGCMYFLAGLPVPNKPNGNHELD